MKKYIEENIYKENLVNVNGVRNEMSKVLIATLYSAEPVMLSLTKLGVDRLILIIDKDPDKKQKESLELIEKSVGKIIEIKTIKTEVYDIVKVAEEVTKAIDILSDKDTIFVNITGSKRTQALGLLFASYSRIKRIKQIIYVALEDNKIIYLPKLSFDLNNSQKLILEEINKRKIKSHSEFSEKVDISRGMLYRTITELQNLGLVIQDEEEGFKLTDAGRIAIL